MQGIPQCLPSVSGDVKPSGQAAARRALGRVYRVARRFRTVDTARDAPGPLLGQGQISLLLESVQVRIERTGAELVAMPAKLLDHCLAIDRFLDRVVQHMESDQSDTPS